MLKPSMRLMALFAIILGGPNLQAVDPVVPSRTGPPAVSGDKVAVGERVMRKRAMAQARQAAAVRQQAALKAKGGKVDPKLFGRNPAYDLNAIKGGPNAASTVKPGDGHLLGLAVPGPGFQVEQPDYMFGTAGNYHYTKPIRKFVDTLPGLSAAHKNNLGNFIPVAKPVAGVYADGSDYYELAEVEYTQQLHSELAPTRLRGYQDISANAEVTANGATNSSNYLGPFIFAKKDKPVRVKMTNLLPTGAAGDLFLPVDTTMVGAGMGPLGIGNGTALAPEVYKQNRTGVHLHGGLNPWISDGTPHQWITPQGEITSYPKGATFQNVPDMGAGTPGDGIATYYYPNQQSSRLLWYHDHTFALTRLNVYAGLAAGYLLTDPVEEKLITAGILPDNGDPTGVYRYGIPLVLQDKTFVDTSTLGTLGVMGGTDPTWSVAKWGGDGSLWYPHVYMPNQNPADMSGSTAMGRWDYGAWFWPPMTTVANGGNLVHGAEPVPNDPNGTEYPGTPNPSLTPEAFMDTPVVNGAAYPKLAVEPRAYRFRMLNASNDRYWSLSFFVADATGTDVSMVPANSNPLWPSTWPKDGRDGGVPDPATAGPSFIQIGNESGFLATPTVIVPQAVNYDYNRRNIVVLNVIDQGLALGAAERADVIVDFSGFAGKKIILYNDAPTPWPAFDPRYDFYTGDVDLTSTGGAPSTQAGYGPNTRTVMLFEVAATTPAPAFNLAALNTAFQSTPTFVGAFAESQQPPIVPQLAYRSAMNSTPSTVAPIAFTNNVYFRIQDNQSAFPFPATENGDLIQPPLQPKAIPELFELDYGRMNATLGVELPLTNFNIQTTIPLVYDDPPTEFLTDGTTQYWKITHNGVDTHPVHFHLFDVQVVNRVGWDGAVRLPFANEIGWKETVRMSPLEDIIVAFRPLSPRLPFVLPHSLRSPLVTRMATDVVTQTDVATGNPVTAPNGVHDFEWEYAWHCHILGHEENDFMRPVVLTVATTVPAAATLLTATALPASPGRADLAWTDNATDETGITVQRRNGWTVIADPWVTIATLVPNVRTYKDLNIVTGATYDYQVIAYNQAGNAAASNTAYFNQAAGVSGNVSKSTPAGLVPVAGVILTTTTGESTVTDASGNYSFSLPPHFTGSIIPALLGLTFTPASLSYANLLSSPTGQNFTAANVVSISGTVSRGAGVQAGVTLTASSGQTAVTNASGAYTLILPAPFSGMITPSLTGYVFAPTSRAYTAVSVDQTAQNYVASPLITISGRALLGGTGLADTTITFMTGATVTHVVNTDATGAYSVSVPAPYTGTATAFKAGYYLTPVGITFAARTTNQANQNFTAVVGVAVSGLITTNAVPAVPLPGVTVTFSNGVGTAVTDASGLYTRYVPTRYSGSVTPALAGWMFTPISRNLTNVTAAPASQNFTGAQLFTVTGTITSNGLPLAGVRVTFSNNAGVFATTTAAGTYTQTLVKGWTGTITPTLTGRIFLPAVVTVTTPLAGNLVQNFVTAQTIAGVASTRVGGANVGLAGVTITLSTGGTVTSAANGTFTVTVPTGWTGNISASDTNLTPRHTWTPVSFIYTNLRANVAGIRFSGI